MTKVVERHPHPKYPRLSIQLRSDSRFYQAVTYLDGKLRQTSTKATHFPSALKLAADWYQRQVRASAQNARQHPIDRITADPTMAELYRSYKAELPKAKRGYAEMKWNPIADFWRTYPLSAVTTQAFKEFYKWRRSRDKVKSHTLHKDVVLLRQILKYAMGEEFIDHLPFIPSVGKIEPNPRPWLTPQEFGHLLDVAYKRWEGAPNERVKQQRLDVIHFMEFLVSSMMRIGELRTLRFRSCRIEENEDGNSDMLLCEVSGKRGTRTVVTDIRAVDVFLARKDFAKPDDLIFPAHCRDSFRELLIAADMREDPTQRGFTRNLKSLRASAISHKILENPNLNLQVIARNAGTSTGMIDHFYARRLTAEMHKHELSRIPKAKKDKKGKKRA